MGSRNGSIGSTDISALLYLIGGALVVAQDIAPQVINVPSKLHKTLQLNSIHPVNALSSFLNESRILEHLEML
jgi:hypothetical protein